MTEVMPAACAACALSRREFVGRSTLAAVTAMLASACGGAIDAVTNPLDPAAGGSVTLTLADYPALANVGGIARVNAGGAPVAVVRQSATTFLAFSMACPHAGTTVNIVGSGFVCPNHGARFNAAGQWTGGQSTSALVSVPVTYDAAAGTLTLGAVTGPATGGGGGDDDDDDDEYEDDDD